MTARVLHLITRFLHGGAETTTKNTLAALDAAPEAYDLSLGFGASFDSEHVATVRQMGIDTVSFRTLRHYNPVTQVVAVGAIARYLRRNDIDIVHTHSTEGGIVGRYAAALARTPVVIHEVHGDPVTTDRPGLFNRLLVALERSAAPLSTAIVVKADRIGRVYRDRGIGSPDQYVRIYHGIDLDTFRDQDPTTTPPRTADCRLLFVGRLAEGKGLFDLLAAVDRLRETSDVELLVAGDGPLRAELQEAVDARGLDTHVSFLGYREDVPALLASADVFVLPSYREGTPRVITEALASGVPVVSTNIAGIPDQVADGVNGYLVTPGDIDALVDRLSRLADDVEHRGSLAAKTRIDIERFDIDHVQQQYRDLYRRLCCEADIPV